MAILTLVGGLALLDIAVDVAHGGGGFHVLLEAAVVLAATIGVGWLWRDAARERARLDLALRAARREGAAWRDEASHWHSEAKDALAGLSVAIDTQFQRWALTPAEREVGLLLLKGLSHKEIAAVLEKAERTVRQQSLGIYKKAGLAGRAELSAFFLEDLLLPAP